MGDEQIPDPPTSQKSARAVQKNGFVRSSNHWLMAALPVPEAAAEMDVPLGTLRRWVREGCPTVSPGRRGRGHAVLVDPDVVSRWRQAGSSDAVVLELAASLPAVLASAVVESWQQAQGIDKRALAGITAATWFMTANAVADHLRARCPGVPEVSQLPDEIERLRKIARR